MYYIYLKSLCENAVNYFYWHTDIEVHLPGHSVHLELPLNETLLLSSPLWAESPSSD